MDSLTTLLWRIGVVAAVVALLLTGSGCDSASNKDRSAPSSHPYKAVATVGMVADIVRQVAGDRAEVEQLIGSGVDPHMYKPTRRDRIAIRDADIVFYAGLLLEGKMANNLEHIDYAHPVTELIDRSGLLASETYTGKHDPHVWMDVELWQRAVDAVADKLAAYDTANADYYNQNAADYLKRLKNLDAYAHRAIGSIPQERRILITAHDAFSYFGAAYGIEVHGIQGLSTESQAGLHDINRLVDVIVERRVPAIFVESSVSERNVEALIEGARERGQQVRTGGTLFSDAMGAQGTYEGTYVGMLDHNITTIARALGGDAPARGMNGKLSQAGDSDE